VNQLQLSDADHSSPQKYSVVPAKGGSPMKLEILLQECSNVEKLRSILCENSQFSLNIILVFHDASDASFNTCQRFYEIVQRNRRDSRVLWIGNMDQSFEANHSRKDSIGRLVGEEAPSFLQTSLVEPNPNLQVIIRSFFADIMQNNQLETNERVLEELSSACSDSRTLEVSQEHFESVWMCRRKVEEESVKTRPTRYSSVFNDWPFTPMFKQSELAKVAEVEQKAKKGQETSPEHKVSKTSSTKSGFSPSSSSTTRETECTDEKLGNMAYLSQSNGNDAFDTNDDTRTEGKWAATLRPGAQWLQRFCFGCGGRA
jgi:hypothetical protein